MDVLQEFLRHFRIDAGQPPRQLLDCVVTAFSRLPYENITKIIKSAESGSPEKARRYPEEVVSNHIDWGTGGTCFSLTTALRHLVRSLGWRAEYVLADRSYGQNTHCALLVWIEDVPHLIDPGYLLLDPIPLSLKGEREVATGSENLILSPDAARNEVSLYTVRKGTKLRRLTYKAEPVDAGEFQKAWDASFQWEMMRYPLLTRTQNARQFYMRGSMLQVRDRDSMERQQISADDLIAKISAEFQILPSVVARAISILKSGGEL